MYEQDLCSKNKRPGSKLLGGEQGCSRHGDAYHAAGVTGPSEDVTREKGSTEKGWLKRDSRL